MEDLGQEIPCNVIKFILLSSTYTFVFIMLVVAINKQTKHTFWRGSGKVRSKNEPHLEDPAFIRGFSWAFIFCLDIAYIFFTDKNLHWIKNPVRERQTARQRNRPTVRSARAVVAQQDSRVRWGRSLQRTFTPSIVFCCISLSSRMSLETTE